MKTRAEQNDEMCQLIDSMAKTLKIHLNNIERSIQGHERNEKSLAEECDRLRRENDDLKAQLKEREMVAQ